MAGNAVQLVGNITRDPELRYTPTGQPTASFGLAVNRRWQNKQTQEWEEATSFIDVVTWRDLAEHCAESLGRGSRVIVIGRMEQRSWETQDGDKRSKVEVVADEVGPSLRWATAQVSKASRTSGESNNSGGGNNGGGSSNNNGANNQQYVNVTSGGGQSNGGDPGWGQDEEPF